TAVAAEDAPEELFRLVAEEVAQLLDASISHLIRYEPDGSGAVIVAGWAESEVDRLPNGLRMALDSDTATTRVWRTGQPARRDGYEGISGSLAATLREHRVQSLIAAPIALAGRLWGAVIVSSTEAAAFPAGAEQRIADFAAL